MNLKTLPGGLLVAVEGIDGAGKTTVARAIADMFRAIAVDVVVSKEPTNGPWGQRLRETAFTARLPAEQEAELLVLDRREHVANLIEPGLRRGAIVVLDRYFPSMIAYQGAEGLDPADLLRRNDFAPRPDVTLLLDLDPAQGLSRIHARGDKPNAFETLESLSRCRAIFLSLHLGGTRVIDASRPLVDVIAEAQKAVLLAIAAKLSSTLQDPVAACGALQEFLPNLNPEFAQTA